MAEKRAPSDVDRVAAGMSKVVSAHGHGFHYAVMRRAQALENQGLSYWVFEAAEFPVTAGSVVTHVDFILRARRGATHLVAECKRADPRRARWCFLKTPYTRRNSTGKDLVFEAVSRGTLASPSANARVRQTSGGPCNLAFELSTGEIGDGIGGKPAVNDAATQVLRSVNGLVNHQFVGGRYDAGTDEHVVFLPVIFTTAELWISPADLGDADIATGTMRIADATRADWLWFNHNQSPALRHGLPRADGSVELSLSLRSEFCRTIAIVSPSGVDEFLGRDFDEFLRD